MPYTMDNMPERIQGMPKHAQEIWMAAYNSAYEQYAGDEGQCNATAWAAVERDYEKDADGQWRKKAGKSADLAALKFADADETVIEGILAPYGGPHNGRDVQGEYFSAKTDFALDWYEGDRPLLYQHGLDAETGVAVVGRIKSLKRLDPGLWMQAQLNARDEYYGAIRELVKAGKLGLSSGSMRHLVRVDKSGEILRWPLVEGSLTPSPANLLAHVGIPEVKAHFKAIDVELPDAALAAGAPPDLKSLIASVLDDDQATVKALSDIGLADHASFTMQLAAALTQRTKDLSERRVKEGRVLSTTNRRRLTECLGSMRQAADDLAALLDSTDPAAAEAKAATVRRLRAQLEASRLRALAM